MSILNSLHESSDTTVNFDIDATPLDIIKGISDIFETDSTSNHHLLKQKAEATKLTSETSVEEYIQSQSSCRTKMRNEKYPNISDELITGDFIIKG